MAFKESKNSGGFKEAGGPLNKNDDGLPLNWENLEEQCCPKCAEPLVEFPHIDFFKCMCGFKISSYRMEEVLKDMEYNNEGFNMAHFHDDFPF